MPHLRWWIAGLLFLSTVINYVDRQTLSVLAPELTKTLGMSAIEYSYINSAFLVAYTVMYVGSGFIVDRFGTRVSLALFMAWWSVANMAHSLAQGAWSLGALRFLLGMGESGNFMAAFKVVSERYPAKERAFVNGLIQAGATLGAVVAIPLATSINAVYGWRPAFVITGALGLVWLVFWLWIYREPETIEAAEERSTVSFRKLLGYPQTWGLMVSRFLSDPVWWFYLFWLPKYMVEKRGFTMVEMAAITWLPYLTADIGALFGGWLSGRLISRGMEVLQARRMSMLPFALMMPLSLLVNHVSSTAALALMSIITFAHMAWKANQSTLTNDIFPKPMIGRASGVLAFGNGLGGTLFTWSTGYIVQWFGYDAIFFIMGLLHPAAFLITHRYVRKAI